MIYTTHYNSPLGDILLASKNNKLIGLWLPNQNNYLSSFLENIEENDNCPILINTKNWLNRYFNKEKPNINELELNPYGSNFRKIVWDLLKEIPYGHTTTYKDIAIKVAKIKGVNKMSSQAIGNAISNNPISIIIPCHRVIGSNGKLIGYNGGLDYKIYLLNHEKNASSLPFQH